MGPQVQGKARWAAGQASPLGNNVGNVSGCGEQRPVSERANGPQSQQRPRRPKRVLSQADVTRRRLRAVAQRVAPPGSNRDKCGRTRATERIRFADGRWQDVALGIVIRGVQGHWAAFAGLVTCGSAWACPVCSAKIARERAEEVRRAIANCRAQGGEVYMVTLTTPHDQGDRLKPLQRATANSWRYVIQGRAWQDLQRDLGLVGFVRGADDPTLGPNGWHPHLHVLAFFARPLSAAELDRLRVHAYRRWAKSVVEKHGYRMPSWEHGVTLTVSHDDAYITKLGLADELTGGMYKQAHGGHRTPLQLLVDAEAGDKEALELYREFADAMHGRKRVTWSQETVTLPDGSQRRRSLRARYLTEPERTGEEIAGQADGREPEAEPFAVPVPMVLWDTAIVNSPERQSELCNWGKLHGPEGVRLALLYVEVESKAARLAGLGPYGTIGDVRKRAAVDSPRASPRDYPRAHSRVLAGWPPEGDAGTGCEAGCGVNCGCT